MKKNNYKLLATSDGLTTYHYKVILLLLTGSDYTQVQMAELLNTTKQNINKVCQQLHHMDIITKKRFEGRNIFWGINPNPSLQMPGQIKLEA